MLITALVSPVVVTETVEPPFTATVEPATDESVTLIAVVAAAVIVSGEPVVIVFNLVKPAQPPVPVDDVSRVMALSDVTFTV